MSGRVDLSPIQIQALQFLYLHGPHEMARTAESMEQVSAILVFGELKRLGLIVQSIGHDVLTYRLTPKGRDTVIDQAASADSSPSAAV